MRTSWTGACRAALAAATLLGAAALVGCDDGPPAAPPPDAEPVRGRAATPTTGVLDLICELHLDLDGQVALGIQGNEPPRITIAQVDLDKGAGWYQGKLSISEGRAGALTVSGRKLVVARPALFQRFGTTITREEFSVDRDSGEFVQSLTLQDGRTVRLIKGTCARVTRPPF